MKLCKIIIINIFLIIVSNSLFAQYIIEQIDYQLPIDYELIPEDAEFDSFLDEVNFFFNIPEDKLKQFAQESGEEINMEKSTIYHSGDKVAAESESEMGKVTMISDFKTGISYYVMWAQKKVLTLTKKDLEEMKKDAQVVSDAMLSNLSPEMRAQVEGARNAMINEVSEKPSVKATGKKMKKYGFDCEEYLVQKGEEEVISIWATGDATGIGARLKQISNQFKEIFPSEDEEQTDEWELVSGKIPVETKTFRTSMMEEPKIEVRAITRIEKTNPPANKFIPPGKEDGFTRGSFKDMMKQMIPGMGN